MVVIGEGSYQERYGAGGGYGGYSIGSYGGGAGGLHSYGVEGT